MGQGFINYSELETNNLLGIINENKNRFPLDSELNETSERLIPNSIIAKEINSIKDATSNNKGYFLTEENLKAAYPTASEGSKAYVGNSYPYAIYLYQSGAWANSGQTGGNDTFNAGEFYTRTEIDQQHEAINNDIARVGKGANYEVLEYEVNIATTRLKVEEENRKGGYIITYNAGTGWIKEQYIGISVTNEEWIKDENWNVVLEDSGIQAIAKNAQQQAELAATNATYAKEQGDYAKKAAEDAVQAGGLKPYTSNLDFESIISKNGVKLTGEEVSELSNIINKWESGYIVLVKHYGADKYYDVLGIACTDDSSNVIIKYTSAWGNKTYIIRTDLTVSDSVWNVSPLIPTVPNTFESMPVNTIACTTAKAGNIFGINWLYCDGSNIKSSDYQELKLDATNKLPLIENSYIKSYSILNELGGKSIENAEIGDYLLINGKCLSPRTLTQEERSNVIGVYLGELEDGKKRFAFVGYLGAEACKVQIGTTGQGQYISFINFNGAYRLWYDDYDTSTGTPSLISNATQNKEAAMQLIDGKTYTNEILSKEWADKAYAAKYCNLVSLPDQFGKCYLPSIKEFLLLFPSDSDTKEKLTNSLSKLGYELESILTSSFYTSVQYDKDNAWVVQEYNDNADVNQSSISAAGYGYNVWPFIMI